MTDTDVPEGAKESCHAGVTTEVPEEKQADDIVIIIMIISDFFVPFLTHLPLTPFTAAADLCRTTLTSYRPPDQGPQRSKGSSHLQL